MESEWTLLSSRPWSDLSASSPVCDLNPAQSPGLTSAPAAEGLDGSPVEMHKEHGAMDGWQVN